MILPQREQQEQSPQQFMNEIAMAKMRNQKNEAYDLVRRYNQNPKSIKDEDIPRVLQSAEMFGWNITTGRQKDTAGWLEGLTAFVVGGVDGALLDLLKDSWYSTRRTKNHAAAGKVAGLVASLFTPASFGAGLRFAKGMTVGQKALTGLQMAAKYLTAPGLSAGMKRMIGVSIATKVGAGSLDAGLKTVNSMVSRWATAGARANASYAIPSAVMKRYLIGKQIAGGELTKEAGLALAKNIHFGKSALTALPMIPSVFRWTGTLGSSDGGNPYEMAEMPRMPIAQP